MKKGMNISLPFLPTTMREAHAQGIDAFDVIIVTADAYVDHPAFGAALIGRYVQSLGLKVGIIPQPDWRSTADFTVLGRPRLFFGVTAGNLDSMVALYTVQRKIRSDDQYSEYGTSGKRPFLPTVVYTNRLKEAYKNVPVIIGGIEASLRRIAHYEYYTDTVKPSILLDAKADLLIYGNGEAPLTEIINRLRFHSSVDTIKNIAGTAVIVKGGEKKTLPHGKRLPSFEEVKNSTHAFNLMTKVLFENLNPFSAGPLYQEAGTRGVLIHPPALPLDTSQLDRIYALPFKRQPHPRYKGNIPAFDMIKYSITAHRGCYGGCSFCSLGVHQGKIVNSRSVQSICGEVERIALQEGKKIVVSDIGGPTANMYGTFCKNQEMNKICTRRSCLFPAICKNLHASPASYMKLLQEVRELSCVKKVYINSGIRCDVALLDASFISALATYYTPGQLSVAPEHCASYVLNIMHKPGIDMFEKFACIFFRASVKGNVKNVLAPYFIVGHPGADHRTESELKLYMRQNRIQSKQIQEFYPTPMTVATAMYYTGMDPWTGKRITVEKKLGIKKSWKKL